MTFRRWTAAVALGLALPLLAAAPAGAATTTIGQLAPDPYTTEPGPPPYYYTVYKYTPPPAICETSQDYLQSSVSAGASYVVPTYGERITTWRTNAAAGAGQTMTFKVFRKVGDPATYEVVGHDGPRALVAPSANEKGKVNSFSGLSIPVQAGDVIGLYPSNAGTVHDACMFAAGGNYLFSTPALGDGASGPFTSASGDRLNVTADVTVTPPGGSPPQHTLTVSLAGTGYGAVQSSPAGIDACSASCSHAYDEGTAVTLTATPDSYSTFGGWSGGGCSGQGTCQVTNGADTTVTATFTIKGGGYEYGPGGYNYGPGGYGPSGGGGTTGTGSPGTVISKKCKKAAGHKRRHKTSKSHCGRSKVVAKAAMSAALGKKVLATKRGRTLYSLSAEHGTSFICTGECLSTWHPLSVPGGVQPIGPVKLGTVKRPEGGIQVTYHGRPLYTFSGDTAPGEANGQGFKDVGTWSAVVAPAHRPARNS